MLPDGMPGPEVELCPGRSVGPAHPVFVIAEIGQNHQGDPAIARQLITAAARAGADCVKLQKSSLPDKFTAGALARPYSGPHSWGATYGEHKAHLELSEQQYRDLKCHAKEEGIAFTASAMDSVSAAFLHQLDVPFIKVGSGDANNLPLMREIAERGRPMVVSTGMCGMSWVRTLHSTLSRQATPLVLLQCTSSYPARPANCNLRVLQTYRTEFPNTVLGYSGHEEGVAISLAAASLGAAVIERHFSLDRNMKGSDHKCSLTPPELGQLVRLLREGAPMDRLPALLPGTQQEVEAALGSPTKAVLDCELTCRAKLGKTLVAARRIPRGTTISSDWTAIKVAQPPGIDPRNTDLYLGLTADTDIEQDEAIQPQFLTTVRMSIIQHVAHTEQ